MKILVVNGYSKKSADQERFSLFRNSIEEAVREVATMGYSMPTIIDANLNNIDHYIYERNSIFSNEAAKRRFDSLDLIIIDGCMNLLPWERRLFKLRKFFLACKKTNKCLFAAGFGMGMLTYYCATRCVDLNVVNGGERGGEVSEIGQIPGSVLTRVTASNAFLDYTTGDYYRYNADKNEWRAEGNVSLHYTRKATLTAAMGPYMKKSRTYRTKSLPELYQIYRSRNDELISYIKKPYVQHWIFENIPHQYLVLHDNTWDVHPVNITEISVVKKNYTILSDCDRGPEIVEHMNTIAMQSNVSRAYPETLQVLHNFVCHQLLEIFSRGRIDRSIDAADREAQEAVFLGFSSESHCIKKEFHKLHFLRHELVVVNNAVAAERKVGIRKSSAISQTRNKMWDSSTGTIPRIRKSNCAVQLNSEMRNHLNLLNVKAAQTPHPESLEEKNSESPTAPCHKLSKQIPFSTNHIRFRIKKRSSVSRAEDRVTLRMQTPYLTTREIEIEEKKKNKEKWLDKKGFCTTIRGRNSSSSKLCLEGPYFGTHSTRFRTENRDSWIGGPFMFQHIKIVIQRERNRRAKYCIDFFMFIYIVCIGSIVRLIWKICHQLKQQLHSGNKCFESDLNNKGI